MSDSPSRIEDPAPRFPRTAVVLVLCAVAMIGLEALDGREKRESPARDPARSVGRSQPKRERPPSVESPAGEVKEGAVTAMATSEFEAALTAESAPVVTSEPIDPSSLRVERILFAPGDPDATFAVVSGRAVRRGDRVGGHLVTAVERQRVTLEGGGVLEVDGE